MYNLIKNIGVIIERGILVIEHHRLVKVEKGQNVGDRFTEVRLYIYYISLDRIFNSITTFSISVP